MKVLASIPPAEVGAIGGAVQAKVSVDFVFQKYLRQIYITVSHMYGSLSRTLWYSLIRTSVIHLC